MCNGGTSKGNGGTSESDDHHIVPLSETVVQPQAQQDDQAGENAGQKAGEKGVDAAYTGRADCGAWSG